MRKPITLSATRKNSAAITTKMKTMPVVIMVSRRVGQVDAVRLERLKNAAIYRTL